MTHSSDPHVVKFVTRAELESERERQRLIREARAHYESVFPSEPGTDTEAPVPGGRF